ncbi:hypothetical protein RN49_20985 [Pantoea agglomerans]|nr:hypothetical protein RN49_20985 [Pantoea agglomerans]
MRIVHAIPGVDALLFRHTISSRLGLIMALKTCAELSKGGDDGQWSKASAAWTKTPGAFLNSAKRWPARGRASWIRRVDRRPSLQGYIYGDFTELPPFPTE